MRSLLIALTIGVVAFGAVLALTADRSGQAPEVAAAPADTPPSTGRYWVQRDRGEGGVEIEVTYVTADYLRTARDAQALRRYQPDKYTVFLVAMNTHSVDLLPYEMMKVSELRTGGKTYTPMRWESTSDNTHHRSGILIFPKIDPPLPVELVITTVAGVPARTFRWAP